MRLAEAPAGRLADHGRSAGGSAICAAGVKISYSKPDARQANRAALSGRASLAPSVGWYIRLCPLILTARLARPEELPIGAVD